MKENIYKEKNIRQLIILFGVPSILALIIEMLTGITDTAFAGNLPLVGQDALSSMALISPILSLFTAMQTLFSMSSGVLLAKHFNNEENKKTVLLVGVTLSLVVSTIVSLICAICLEPILRTVGANDQVFELAAMYLKIQLLSNIVSCIGYTMTCAIRAIGYPKIEMIIIIIAVITNIIFNALLSFGFNMGIQGLALGTLISELICVIFATLFLSKRGLFQIKHRIKISDISSLGFEMFKIGFAQTTIQMLSGCTGFFVNSQLLKFESVISVAAWTISQKIYIILLMPIVGLSQGVQTIIAYFNSNEEQSKVNQISILTQKYCFIYGIIALAVIILVGEKILQIFGGTFAIRSLSYNILIIIFCCFPLVGIFYTNLTLFQVTEKEVFSVLLALTRQVFLLLPLLIILPIIFATFNIPPIFGLFVATPISDCGVVLISYIIKKYNKL